MRNARRADWWVLLAAAGIHGALLGAVAIRTGRIDGFAFQSLDCREYYTIAANVLDYSVFSQTERAPLEPDTWRTPGYPLFLSACMAAVGKSPTCLILVQQFLGLLNVVLVFQIAQTMMAGRRAFLAAMLAAIEPYHLYYTLWLMSTTLQTTLLLLIWRVWVGHGRSATRWRQVAALGLLSGLLVSTWPGAILVPLVVLLGIMLSGGRHVEGFGPRIGLAATFLALLCLTVGGWMGRNRAIGGSWALSHQSGIVLAYFKAAEVELWREGRTADRYMETSLDPKYRDAPHRVWEGIDQRLQGMFQNLPVEQQQALRWPNLAQGNRTGVNSFELSRQLGSIGLAMLLDSPWSAAACVLTRCLQILIFPMDLAVAPPRGAEVNRLKSTTIGLGYVTLALAAAVGVYRRRWRDPTVYFPLACTMALLVAATPQTDPRFRAPMVPLLVILALLPHRWKKSHHHGTHAAVSAVAAAGR